MEEGKLIKAASNKEPAIIDPSSLYQQCQDQLERLNEQLAHFIACQRNAKLNRIIPSISSLNRQIDQIQTSISHEVTLEQSTSQKQMLLQKKEALISSIQLHSKKIEKYKKQMILLNINHEELMREFDENQKTISEKEMTCSILSKGKENDAIEKKQSVPSLFSQNYSRLETNRSSMGDLHDGESRWAKIDRMLDRLAGLQFNGLSKTLVELAKRESGTIKGVFRNYKTNDKITEFAKSHEVRRELSLLVNSKKK